jgi:hypothetical protein
MFSFCSLICLPNETGSVMHYDAFAFAKNRERPTIITKQQGTELGQRRGFSDVCSCSCETNQIYNDKPSLKKLVGLSFFCSNILYDDVLYRWMSWNSTNFTNAARTAACQRYPPQWPHLFQPNCQVCFLFSLWEKIRLKCFRKSCYWFQISVIYFYRSINKRWLQMKPFRKHLFFLVYSIMETSPPNGCSFTFFFFFKRFAASIERYYKSIW